MQQASGTLVKFESLAGNGTPIEMTNPEGVEALRRLVCNPGALDRLIELANNPALFERLRHVADKLPGLEDMCRTLQNRCNGTDKMFEQVICPGNVNFSQRTLDEYSDNAQINLEEIITGLGGIYLNAFPVTPAHAIRLTHLARPGYTPTKIAIDLNIAGGATNYLDFVLQFYLVPGGSADAATGLAVGSQMRGNQFLNKDGTQIHVPWPEYRGAPLQIGSMETLALVITNTGAANNLDSAFVTIYYDNKAFYQACKVKCGC